MGSDRVRYGLTPWQAVANAERERNEARDQLTGVTNLYNGLLKQWEELAGRAKRAEARVEELEAALEDDASA